MNRHEWIKVHGVTICHWCGIVRDMPFRKVGCEGTMKMTTKGGKLRIEYRKVVK